MDFVGSANTEENILKDIRMAIGAVKNTIVRDREFEDKLKGLSISEIKGDIDNILLHYDNIISPIDDKRSTEYYRRTVVRNIIKDFIMNLK